MNSLKEIELVSTGIYLPGEPVSFDKIEDVIGGFDGAPENVRNMIPRLKYRMRDIIGIERCHFAIDPVTKKLTESNTSMSVKAIRKALKNASMKPQDIDCIILATPVPDCLCPATTTLIQQELKIEKCAEFEVHANCSGMSKIFQIAYDALRLGRYKNIAVVYSQFSSSYLRSSVYNHEKVGLEHTIMRWVLSDGASAMILSAVDKVKNGIKISGVYNDSVGGNLEKAAWSNLGGLNLELVKTHNEGTHHFGENHAMLGSLGPIKSVEALERAMSEFNLKKDDIDHIVATIPTNIIFNKAKEMAFEKLSVPTAVWKSNFNRVGFAGGASLIVVLDELLNKKVFKKDELLLMLVIEGSKWMLGGVVLESK